MSAVVPENVSAVLKILNSDNRYCKQLIQEEFITGSAAASNDIHEELHMKIIICRWVFNNLTEY